MTGREAKNHIINALPDAAPVDGSKMVIGRSLAYDLLKCDRNEIGELSERFFKEGIAALEGQKLFGYLVSISPDLIEDEVEFK